MSRIDVPVLIVGAGPVGLMGAIALSRHGVEARLLERRSQQARAPAAHVVNARTLEICRAAGVDMEALGRLCGDPRDAGQTIWMTRLAGEEIARLPFERQGEEALRFTPTPLRNLAQHHFEAVLGETLARAGTTTVEYGQQWEGAEQDEEGVTSRVRDLSTDVVHEIRSRHLVACDGAGSRVRKSLGIEMAGPPKLESFLMIHFKANLREVVAQRPGILYWLADPEAGGIFVAHDIDREWVYMLPFDSDRETAADYPVPRCEALVRAGIGAPQPPVEIETISTWVMSAQVAERFGQGRIFLAGDSAHRFPPTGGLGLNSGVQDVHGLAWRIAAVEAGWAPRSLLDSYELERRPVAQNNADQSLRNAMKLIEVPAALGVGEEATTQRMRATLDDPEGRAAVEAAIANQAEHFDMLGLQLGFHYEAGALVPDGSSPPAVENPVREFVPSGRPGARLPHAWLKRDGRQVSTLDLLSFDAFTLLTMESSEASKAWATAVGKLAEVPVRVVSLEGGEMEDAERWREACGIGLDGALLIRPDQHVAWRAPSLPEDPARALGTALRQVFGAESV